MTRTLTTLDSLAKAGFLPQGETPLLRQLVEAQPLAVTPALLAAMDPADPADPVAAQFLPREDEAQSAQDEQDDPIGDHGSSPVPGVIHRYGDRALLNLVSSCAAYCRFCFRRDRVGRGEGMLSSQQTDLALAYLAGQADLREVILSGGDPLTLSDAKLASIVARLAAMPQIAVLRIHTRLPVVDPERITDDLLRALESRLPVYLLLHCNHPNELTPAALAALDRLHRAGIVLLSQSVLLRGVNDDPQTLESLMRAFVAARVVPHYLHHPDRAKGTSHFRVPLEKGIALMQDLRQRLSGLCQPTYMLELPGQGGKIAVQAGNVQRDASGAWRINAADGKIFLYTE